MNITTHIIHEWEKGHERQNRSLIIPHEETATYFWENTQQIIDFHEGKTTGIKYARYGESLQKAIIQKLCFLEECENWLLFDCGMSAITTTILSLVKTGDHILYLKDCYKNTENFFEKSLPKYGISTTGLSMSGIENIDTYIQSNTVIFFCECPTNPFLRVINLKKTKEKLKDTVLFIVDSTLATPLNLKPAKWWADIVIHSLTKYLAGHHDMLWGFVASSNEIIQQIQKHKDIFGGVLAPQVWGKLLSHLKTLELRINTHNSNAMTMAKYLEEHRKVEKVWYPGLPSHSDYSITKKQMSWFGWLITFSLIWGEKEVRRFVDALKIPYIASNIWWPESLVEPYRLLSFYNDAKKADEKGITSNIIRYSVGFENTEDMIQDFENAFKQI